MSMVIFPTVWDHTVHHKAWTMLGLSVVSIKYMGYL